jgi:hypothetical protein
MCEKRGEEEGPLGVKCAVGGVVDASACMQRAGRLLATLARGQIGQGVDAELAVVAFG